MGHPEETGKLVEAFRPEGQFPRFATPEERENLPEKAKEKCWPIPKCDMATLVVQLAAKVTPNKSMNFLKKLEELGFQDIKNQMTTMNEIYKELINRGLQPERDSRIFRNLVDLVAQEFSCKDTLNYETPKADKIMIEGITTIRKKLGTFMLADKVMRKILEDDEIKLRDITMTTKADLLKANKLAENIWWAINIEIIIARREFSVLRLETLEFPFSSSLNECH